MPTAERMRRFEGPQVTRATEGRPVLHQLIGGKHPMICRVSTCFNHPKLVVYEISLAQRILKEGVELKKNPGIFTRPPGDSRGSQDGGCHQVATRPHPHFSWLKGSTAIRVFFSRGSLF